MQSPFSPQAFTFTPKPFAELFPPDPAIETRKTVWHGRPGEIKPLWAILGQAPPADWEPPVDNPAVVPNPPANHFATDTLTRLGLDAAGERLANANGALTLQPSAGGLGQPLPEIRYAALGNPVVVPNSPANNFATDTLAQLGLDAAGERLANANWASTLQPSAGGLGQPLPEIRYAALGNPVGGLNPTYQAIPPTPDFRRFPTVVRKPLKRPRTHSPTGTIPLPQRLGKTANRGCTLPGIRCWVWGRPIQQWNLCLRRVHVGGLVPGRSGEV